MQSIKKLLLALNNYVPTPVSDFTSLFEMQIDNIFSVTGRGTVVTSTIIKGCEAEIVGFNPRAEN
jgi:elongation factor Tu